MKLSFIVSIYKNIVPTTVLFQDQGTHLIIHNQIKIGIQQFIENNNLGNSKQFHSFKPVSPTVFIS